MREAELDAVMERPGMVQDLMLYEAALAGGELALARRVWASLKAEGCPGALLGPRPLCGAAGPGGGDA